MSGKECCKKKKTPTQWEQVVIGHDCLWRVYHGIIALLFAHAHCRSRLSKKNQKTKTNHKLGVRLLNEHHLFWLFSRTKYSVATDLLGWGILNSCCLSMCCNFYLERPKTGQTKGNEILPALFYNSGQNSGHKRGNSNPLAKKIEMSRPPTGKSLQSI